MDIYKTIWIDLVNSPHVLLMEPVINELKLRHYNVIITARDFSSTLSLLDSKKIEYISVGKHGGNTKALKIFQMIYRDVRLYFLLRKKNIDLSIGQASYDSAIVSKILKIPSITTFDYEYADAILKVLLKYVSFAIIPMYIAKEKFLNYDINLDKINYFDGLKENIYLYNFIPNKESVSTLLKKDKINLLIRPAAESSEYYRGIKKHLIDEVCEYLIDNGDYHINLAPRTRSQANKYKMKFPTINILEDSFDGPQLVYWSDAVISSGGTMIREAAALGTIAISSTDLKVGAVDQYLIDSKLLHYIKSLDNFKEISLLKSNKDKNSISDKVFNQFINFVEKVLNDKT